MARMRHKKGNTVRPNKDGATRKATHRTDFKNGPTRSRTYRTGAVLAAIVLLGLMLRISYLRELVDSPDFSLPQIDACYHDYWARGLATGDWTLPKNLSNWEDPKIRSSPYLRPPGYPFFLAGVYYFSHGNYLTTRIVQMALGLVNCVLAYFLGRKVFGRKTGLIFAFLMSFYWVFIYFEGELLAPVLLVTLGLSLFCILSLWADRFTFQRGLAGGLLLGLFALVRSNILLFAPIVLAWTWWVARRRQDHRRLAPIGLGFLIGTVVTIAPVTIRNWIVSKEFVPITTNVGINLYIGNHDGATGRYAIIPDLQALGAGDDWTCFDYPKIVRGVAALTGKETKYSDVSSYFVDKSLAFMRAHPGQALKLVATKAALFWGPEEVGSNKAISLEKANSPTLRYMPGFPLPVALAIFGLIQIFLARRKHPQEDNALPPVTNRQFELSLLISLFILTYFLSYLPFFIVGRYRIPIIPFLLLFGAYGLSGVGQWVVSARYRAAAIGLAALASLYVVASIPLVPSDPNPARWHLLRASCYRLADKPDLAIQECQEAVRANPELDEGHRRLADMLYRKKDFAGAIEHYAKAVALRPDYMEARYNLATALLGQDRLDEAMVHLRWMVEHYPNQPNVHYLLAGALRSKGQSDEAIDHYRRAITLKPDYAQAHNNLANALMAQGKVDEAIGHYRRALEINPNYATARNNMERALRSKNRGLNPK